MMVRPSTLPEPWHTRQLKAGGVGALASELGAGERSVRRWANGEAVPHPLFQERIKKFDKRFDIHPNNGNA